MEISMHPSWKQALEAEFNQPYFKDLLSFVENEYATHICYPPLDQIFSAFEIPLSKIKVVILGQDPYHGANQAHGYCFSVNEGVKFPPSLRNIFEEVRRDLQIEAPQNGNLTRWADQGILLLNATLTVRGSKAGSHQRMGWERFTDAVIKIISDQRQHVVFMLWGNYAKKKGAKIDRERHLVLESGHPSPMSANNGHWFDKKQFSQANSYLTQHHNEAIQW